MKRSLILIAVLAGARPAEAGEGEDWPMPTIALPKRAAGPVITATPAELKRLRAAYKGGGAEAEVIEAVVARADRAAGKPVEFPPRGGQHNQWYQCETCQLALKTVDPTHHRCPGCGKVYSGEPYDDVIYSRVHSRNLRGALDAAWAYAVTGDDKHARFAASVLRGYAKRYATYPYHSAGRTNDSWARKSGGHLYEQTLTEASALATQIAPAYDLIHASPALSAADRAAIRDGLLRPMLRNIDRNKSGKSNWQTWHNAAMLWGGAAVGEAAWVRKAIADPANGFARQMRISVTSDGMWYENSWGYHFYTLRAMVLIAAGAKRLGVDLWGHPALKKMFTLPGRYAMAGGWLPRFGDDVNSSTRHAASLMEDAYAAYRDPAIGRLLGSRSWWDSIRLGRRAADRPATAEPLGSEVFAGAGHAILRTRGRAGLTAAMTFGPYGGFHGHYDKLSFVLFGHGRELGVDPGRAASQAYRLPIHRNWYKATVSHNAVLVDGAGQKPAAGKLELFAATPSYAAAAASCGQAYPGIRHQRLLCMTPSYLLVYDDLAADSEKRFDWLYHHRGSSVRCGAADKTGELPTNCAGREYVRNVRAGGTDGPARAVFGAKGVTTYVTFDGQAATAVRIGDGVGASVLDRVPMMMVSRRGRRVRFVSIIEPVADGEKAAVSGVALESTAAGIRIAIRNGRRTDGVQLTADNQLTVTSGEATVLTGRPTRRGS